MLNNSDRQICVVIPVYNAKKYLYEAVSSVLNQKYKKIEIILIDDGSCDGSSEICDNLAQRSERIFVIHQKNSGVSAARNAGIDYVLNKYDIKATFFVLGNKVEIYQDVLKESLKNGNEIGNHSYSHKWLIKLNKNELEKQIYKTQEIIKKTTGYTPTLLRPTYGSVNNNIKKLTDFKITLWNVDTLDWKYKSVNRIVNRAVKNPKDGNIILMHDIHERTVKAVEKIIPMLKEDGYDLVTVSELRDIQVLRDKMKTNQ